jgi:hypothetical protein
MISIWVKKMIHWRKSPKTSYIERLGRKDFERNTFEFPRDLKRSFGVMPDLPMRGKQGTRGHEEILVGSKKSPCKFLERKVAGGGKKDET